MILLPVFLRNILSAKITAWVDTPLRIAFPVWTMLCGFRKLIELTNLFPRKKLQTILRKMIMSLFRQDFSPAFYIFQGKNVSEIIGDGTPYQYGCIRIFSAAHSEYLGMRARGREQADEDWKRIAEWNNRR